MADSTAEFMLVTKFGGITRSKMVGRVQDIVGVHGASDGDWFKGTGGMCWKMRPVESSSGPLSTSYISGNERSYQVSFGSGTLDQFLLHTLHIISTFSSYQIVTTFI